jgi:DNA-binding NarL/FixJ family response regulator
MATEPLRVAVLSSSSGWSEQLAALLREAGAVESVGAAATIAELGRLTPAPDIVIVDALDAQLSEMLVEGFSPTMPMVILSDAPERDMSLLAGGVAILERNPSAAHLLAALQAAASGLIALSPRHAERLMDAPVEPVTHDTAQWIQPLTPRELQILRMLADGSPNKSIAADLQISEHTAKFHVSQILAKLGAESRTEAVAIGIRHGLVMV